MGGGGGGGRFYGTIAATCRSKEKDTILYMELPVKVQGLHE